MKRFPLQLLVLYPKQALVDWLNALPNAHAALELEAVRKDPTAIVLHVFESDEETTAYVETRAQEFLEAELDLWEPNRDYWPASRDYETLCGLYELIFYSTVYDGVTKAAPCL